MNVFSCIAAQNRRIALVEPFRASDVESGQFRSLPWSPGLTTCPSPSSDKDGVTRLYLEASLLHPAIQIFRIDARTRLEIIHAFETWNVHQDAMGNDSVLEADNRPHVASLIGDLPGWHAVVHLAFVSPMAECDHVSVDKTVIRDEECVGGASDVAWWVCASPSCSTSPSRSAHLMNNRPGIVDGRFHFRVPLHRHRKSFLN